MVGSVRFPLEQPGGGDDPKTLVPLRVRGRVPVEEGPRSDYRLSATTERGITTISSAAMPDDGRTAPSVLSPPAVTRAVEASPGAGGWGPSGRGPRGSRRPPTHRRPPPRPRECRC